VEEDHHRGPGRRRPGGPDPPRLHRGRLEAELRWCGDITYLRIWERWLYLATGTGTASRRVVGYAMADHLRTSLVTHALGNAMAARSPGPGVIFHSDRGCPVHLCGLRRARRDCQVVLLLGRRASAGTMS
jgi:transposase InsO family protein